VGPDGATHNGSFDLSYLRCIPGMVVMTPADAVELRNMLHTAVRQSGPVAVRYPRTQVSSAGLDQPPVTVPVGKAEVRRSGRQVALLAFGALLPAGLRAAEALNATVVNMRFLKPLDENLLLRMARTHSLLVTLEDNVIAGGAGSAVAEFLASQGLSVPILQLGLPDRFLEHGTRDQALRGAGLDEEQILGRVKQRLAALPGRERSRQTRNRFGRELPHSGAPGYVSGALLR
jgi:1-deoxy-D-xylulose-5-phosphate synthase